MTITIDITPHIEADGIHLTVPRMSDDEFWAFCQRHQDLRVERDTQGEIIIMPPTGSDAGSRSGEVFRQLANWNVSQGDVGVAFDAATGFTLPSGAIRSPDASWIRRYRWEALTDAERERFAPICPDFVVELMSPSDNLSDTQRKLEEYIANGSVLGWLIDRRNRQVHVYRPNQPADVLTNPAEVSGDPVLSGFVLDLRRIF